MKTVIGRFTQARRGAIGMLFGLVLVPLVLFVALAIDYSFFAETRSQIQLAADAAVTHAVRAAAGTYSLEVSQGTASATASADALAAGNTAGSLWFTAQLGALLPLASVPTTGPTSCTAAANPCVTTAQLSNAAGFSATVTYQGNYPPFFDNIFHTSATWYITGSSKAQAVYNYVEIMMLIDTSQSMLIGATPADIATLEQYDICPAPNRVSTTVGDNDLYIAKRAAGDLFANTNANNGRSYQFRSLSTSSPTSTQVATGYGATTAPYNDQFDFTTIPASHVVTPASGIDDSTITCKTGYVQSAFTDSVNNPGNAGVPCGFACHNTTTASTADASYTGDLYGFARYINSNPGSPVKLRLDYVMSATEQVITSMINNEQTANEFSIGVYQFNTTVPNNVVALTSATQGTVASGDASVEATYNLQAALTGVDSVDYQITPAETTLPTLVPSADGNTNFTTSVANFVSGKATGGTALAKVTAAANSAANPQKDVFIVTDGLEDECAACTGTRVMGEMTSVATEAPAGGVTAATGSCAKFKALGYNVYVLYIDYYPVPHYTYYVPYTKDPSATSASDSFLNNDYTGLKNGSIQQMTIPASMTGAVAAASVTGTYGTFGLESFADDSPTEAALRACASVNPNGSTASPTYFYEATSAVQIGQQLNLMLETALGSAIRVTN
jgi:Flp pilus assembly protein TadG